MARGDDQTLEYLGRPADALHTPSQIPQPLPTELDQLQVPQIPGSLSGQLRRAIVHTDHKTSFLPLDALDSILAIEDNLASLQQCVRGAGFHEGSLGEVQSFVFNKSASGSPSVLRQRAPGSSIFSVLLLIEKPQEIGEFWSAGLSDEDLPFQFPVKDGVHTIKTKRDQSVERVFSNWTYLEIENFSKHQWTVLSPFFRKPDNGNPDNVYHYDLQPEMILPFETSTEGPNTDSGSYGTVFKVKMHPAHCNFDSYNNRDPLFGIKRLKRSDGVAFKKEVDTLKRFSVRTSKHLIQLLATYKYRNNYYLIFPWADRNLQGLWESIKNPPHSLDLSLWMARQCHGLAVGLSNIHVYQSQPGNEPRVSAGASPSHEKPYGRHNDIKHENVLWFRDNSEAAEEYAGQLKISDFGFVNFNSEGSRSIVPNHVLFTPTYRPPECAVPNHTISRALDLWSLGCLYLEFVTWLLKGYAAATDDFTDKRLSEGQHYDVEEFQDDNFFTIGSDVLSLKPSVIKCMKDLHMDPHCTAYLHDFLDCIANDLLVPNPAERISCAELVCKLEGILQKCEKNHEYCTKGDPRSDHPIRTSIYNYTNRSTTVINSPWCQAEYSGGQVPKGCLHHDSLRYGSSHQLANEADGGSADEALAGTTVGRSQVDVTQFDTTPSGNFQRGSAEYKNTNSVNDRNNSTPLHTQARTNAQEMTGLGMEIPTPPAGTTSRKKRPHEFWGGRHSPRFWVMSCFGRQRVSSGMTS